MDKKIIITHQETSKVRVEEGLLQNLDSVLQPLAHTRYVVLCDSTTASLFEAELQKTLAKLDTPVDILTIPSGEESKSFQSLQHVLEAMLEKKLDRKSAIIALGGGVIGDIATVAAGLYYRGIDCIQIPTTLLGMVDSSIGGKGAVNIGTHKNSIGIIRQPSLILVDPNLLKTLPKDQFVSGMGEIIKYAISMDKQLFKTLQNEDIQKTLPTVIKRCIELKLDIVEQDPLETKNIRTIVNFGHTLGHAVELLLKIPHGQAVSIGMVFELLLSKKICGLNQEDYDACISLLKKYSLPVSMKQLDPKIVLEQMKKDKKTLNNVISFTLIESIGTFKTGQNVADDVILEILPEVMI